MFVFYSYHAQEWMHKVHYIIVTLATLRTNKTTNLFVTIISYLLACRYLCALINKRSFSVCKYNALM